MHVLYKQLSMLFFVYRKSFRKTFGQLTIGMFLNNQTIEHTVILFHTALFSFLSKCKYVCTDSLVGSVPKYSAVTLWTSRVRIITQGTFPILPPLSPTSVPVNSDLSCHNKGKNATNFFFIKKINKSKMSWYPD